ncbi:RraA family protein [Siculibacillus lacustris]|uniref:Putative 4-hydroxy-4-methyl-2-oxoglutarate aldolase n=1 Tax=Siculibacillus lacustris TaxID=1549641 RepID=A0A4Q9VYP8_9HYPH|nr:RraA family protein [Siculibacillus lacustris]TBW41284.1 RraA family protein [Siculibacillus lacustris]
MTSAVERDLAAYQGRLLGLVPPERIRTVAVPRPAAALLARYRALPDLTSSIADVLDGHGVDSAIPAALLPPIAPGQRMVGPAVTVRHGPAPLNAGHNVAHRTSPKLGGLDEVTLSEPGDVMVIDGSGVPFASNIGGLMATAVAEKGFAGIVVDGCVRDVETMRRLGLPVWARGATPRTGKHRMELVEFNGPVTIAGVGIRPGDLILGDTDGVIVVPAALIEAVIGEAEEAVRKEDVLLAALRSGASPAESAAIVAPEKW